MNCAKCVAELDHCHGTVIEHDTAPAECTEPACADLDAARHLYAVSCAELDGGCECTSTLADPLLATSA